MSGYLWRAEQLAALARAIDETEARQAGSPAPPDPAAELIAEMDADVCRGCGRAYLPLDRRRLCWDCADLDSFRVTANDGEAGPPLVRVPPHDGLNPHPRGGYRGCRLCAAMHPVRPRRVLDPEGIRVLAGIAVVLLLLILGILAAS